jgi:hypothetical protein
MAHAAEGLLPNGWEIVQQATGDLNRDGLPDVALVIQQGVQVNTLKKDDVGPSTADGAPRALLIAFREHQLDSYATQIVNQTFIPTHDDPINDDPFDSLAISNGTLHVSLRFWASAGTWFSTSTEFTFRHQDGCFRLIGLDRSELNRATAELTTLSVNYATRKVKTILETMDSPDKRKIRWHRLIQIQQPCFEDIGNGAEFKPPAFGK